MARPKNRTRKPCPGCGHAPAPSYGNVPLWRDVDAVCNECRSKLDHVDEMQIELDRLRTVLKRQGRGTTACELDLDWDSVYLPMVRSDTAKSTEKLGWSISNAIVELTAPLSQGRKAMEWNAPKIPKYRDTFHRRKATVELTPAGIQALRLLHAHLKKVMTEVFFIGLRHGKSFVMEMATGDATLQQIEERVFDAISRHRERDDREIEYAEKAE